MKVFVDKVIQLKLYLLLHFFLYIKGIFSKPLIWGISYMINID